MKTLKSGTWVTPKKGPFAGTRGEVRQQTRDRVYLEIEEVVYLLNKSDLEG